MGRRCLRDVLAGISALVATIQHGEQVYNLHCRPWHGVEGVGGFGPKPPGVGAEVRRPGDPGPDPARCPRMPGFAEGLASQELDDFLTYLKSL